MVTKRKAQIMKVLIYNRVGFVKYIPLTNPFLSGDFDINSKIMPQNLFDELSNFLRERDKKRDIDHRLPIAMTKEGIRYNGCKIVVMSKTQYELKKNEVV